MDRTIRSHHDSIMLTLRSDRNRVAEDLGFSVEVSLFIRKFLVVTFLNVSFLHIKVYFCQFKELAILVAFNYVICMHIG